MSMIRIGAWVATLMLLAAGPAAAAEPRDGRAAALAAAFDRLVAEKRLRGAGLLVLDRNGVVFARTAGDIGPDTPIPIASATKWPSAALVGTVVDEGKLGLETRLGEVLTEAPRPIAGATLRQLFSHTAGMGGAPMLALRDVVSMDDAVAKLLAAPSQGRPGAFFAYGGASMQLAGKMVERRAGKDWATLFDERIAGPLGITTHRWGWLRPTGRAEVPLVGGGLTLSMDDFGRFLRAMLADGVAPDGRRVLSAAMVRAIETDQARGVPVRFRPESVPESWSYGFGAWCEAPDVNGRCRVTSSAGAFGTYPWIDREAGLAGVFVTRARLPDVLAGAVALREAAAKLAGKE